MTHAGRRAGDAELPDPIAEPERDRFRPRDCRDGRHGRRVQAQRPSRRGARSAPERERAFPTPTYFPNVNVPFSHPSELYPQKDGRKVRSRDEGTFTSSTTADDRAATRPAPPAPRRNQSSRRLRPARPPVSPTRACRPRIGSRTTPTTSNKIWSTSRSPGPDARDPANAVVTRL